jgi:fibronectin type 3 domain-containing protein
MNACQLPKILLTVALFLSLSACNKNTAEVITSGQAHSVTLKWTASKSAIAGYRIYRSSQPNTPPGVLAVTSSKETEYVDKSVEAGKTYYYLIKAFDAAGRESTAVTISATIPVDSSK